MSEASTIFVAVLAIEVSLAAAVFIGVATALVFNGWYEDKRIDGRLAKMAVRTQRVEKRVTDVEAHGEYLEDALSRVAAQFVAVTFGEELAERASEDTPAEQGV